jgi:hypothetical protein
MDFAYENLRLKELAATADLNQPVFNDFKLYIQKHGYNSIFSFIRENENERARVTILGYLNRPLPTGVILYDGIARPYSDDKSKWLFLGWLLRDAPEQRLRPMVSSIEGSANLQVRRSILLNTVRKGLVSSFNNEKYWEWHVIREVVIDRLEGSRRAIKGTLFEAIVRTQLTEIFKENALDVEIQKTETRLEGETFDVSVKGRSGTILMPVKTRETMGGGHALLFTRDIHKSISVAYGAGYVCVPIVIAESWSGDLDGLGCEKSIYINKSPNQITIVEPLLRAELVRLLDFIKSKIL